MVTLWDSTPAPATPTLRPLAAKEQIAIGQPVVVQGRGYVFAGWMQCGITEYALVQQEGSVHFSVTRREALRVVDAEAVGHEPR